MLNQFSGPSRTLAAALVALLVSSLAWSAAPAASGPVSRFVLADLAFLALYDESKDLSYIMGFDIVALCTGGDWSENVADVSLQTVLIEGDGLDRLLLQERVEGYAGIWQGNTLDGDLCANSLGTLPVAEGAVSYRYRDNDAWWLDGCPVDSPAHANAWGFTWNGVLEDDFGQPVPFTGQFTALWQQCDPDTYRETLRVRVGGYE